MFKKIALFCSISLALLGCKTNSSFEKADNALDGGRYFIESCMQGDFKKANNYLLIDSANLQHFDSMSRNYYGLDKEGRMQLRQASIQINEVSSIDSNTTIINYQNSFDNAAHKLKVIQTESGWKVDLKYTYSPNL